MNDPFIVVNIIENEILWRHLVVGPASRVIAWLDRHRYVPEIADMVRAVAEDECSAESHVQIGDELRQIFVCTPNAVA